MTRKNSWAGIIYVSSSLAGLGRGKLMGGGRPCSDWLWGCHAGSGTQLGAYGITRVAEGSAKEDECEADRSQGKEEQSPS